MLGRFHEALGQRHHRNLEGESTRLPDPAFDLLGPVPKVSVAVVDLRPGVENPDDRLVAKIISVETHLLEAGTVSEATLVIRGKTNGRCGGSLGLVRAMVRIR